MYLFGSICDCLVLPHFRTRTPCSIPSPLTFSPIYCSSIINYLTSQSLHPLIITHVSTFLICPNRCPAPTLVHSRLLLEDWHLPVSTGFCLSSSLYPPALCLGHTKLPLSWSTLAPRFRIDTCSSVLFFLFVIISFPLFRFPDAHVHIPLSIHISYYIVFVCVCVVLSC